jgi:hypothetical protein
MGEKGNTRIQEVVRRDVGRQGVEEAACSHTDHAAATLLAGCNACLLNRHT